VQYSYDPGSTLWVGDEPYGLVQFHFHAHSEHSLGGFLTPMEMHLVHKNEAEELLVVGALVVPGWHNDTLDLADWPELPGADTDPVDIPEDAFNVKELVPGGGTYRYTGSLTAPPCSNDVSWIVYRRPLVFDQAQIETFTDLYPRSHRETQELGDRELVFGK
jgi:carbonic anhydrase